MNTAMMPDSKVDKKIYSKEDMFRYFSCPKETPDYLKEFPDLLNDNVNDIWHKKPIPKFDETPDNKHRQPTSASKYKGNITRQRTVSNQSGDSITNSTPKPRVENYNRYNLLSESQNNADAIVDVAENVGDSDWKTIETKPHKASPMTKQYSNNQGQENHWKKWGDKNKPASPFPRTEKTNNFIVRKMDASNKSDVTKVRTSRSFTIGTGQTEDIWQDDWETELQFQIATTPHESLESYELPPSSIAVNTLIDVQHCPMSVTCHSSKTDFLDASNYNQWYYLDLSNKVQGPFLSESMANWLATGYFDYATSLRRRCDERFLLLAEYRALYGRIPFTHGSTIPPILHDTTIEIDPMQLTIGVDRSILQKVLTNATSLSNFKNTNSISMDNDIATMNVIDKQLLLVEKRKLDEGKAELERERQRIQDEKEQWKIQLEKEMEIRMQNFYQTMELKRTISDYSMSSIGTDKLMQLRDTVGNAQLPPSEPSVSQLNVDASSSANREDMISKHDVAKNNCLKTWPEPSAMTSSYTKIVDEEKTSIKTNGSDICRRIGEHISDEVKQSVRINESPKSDSLSPWSIKPTILNVEPSEVMKSLLEIQEEETKKERSQQQLEKPITPLNVDANKVTSFKESLLKSVAKPVKSPVLPAGKSFWETQPVDNAVVEKIPKPLEPKNSVNKRTKKPSDNYEKNNNDVLLNWCGSTLSKFNGDLDIVTVVELLKQVPSENVSELTIELLDDSVFSRNFAREFVKKRDELCCWSSIGVNKDDCWQIVKKQSAVTEKMNHNVTKNVVTSSGGGTGKSKTKKKMVVIDRTKLRSS